MLVKALTQNVQAQPTVQAIKHKIQVFQHNVQALSKHL